MIFNFNRNAGRLSRIAAGALHLGQPLAFFCSLTAVVLIASTILGSKAMACRDCPFPMRIDETHWMMPNNKVILNVTEEQESDGSILVKVSLQDSVTGEVFARGKAWRDPGQRAVVLKMRDPKGHHVVGRITWIDFESKVLQADFDCLEDRSCTALQPKGITDRHP